MNKLFFALGYLLLLHNHLHALSWEEIFKQNNLLLQNNTYLIIKEQQAAFALNNAPAIAHQVIKNIGIIDNNEQLIDVNLMNHTRITMLPDAPNKQSFAGAQYNSGLPSASKMRLSLWQKLEHVIIYLDELAEQFGYISGSISIKVFEGLRDIETQKLLFIHKLEEIRKNNPDLNQEALETETAKWVSPYKNNIPVHATGAAVDIRLFNEQTQDFIDLGPFGVIWGTNKEAQTFSENLTDAQKLNRLYLLMATAQAGLVNYVYEYWHYSVGDRYAAYWQEKDGSKRLACYGLAQ